MNAAARSAIALAAALALERGALAHDAIQWNSTQIVDCQDPVVTLSRSDFGNCEDFHSHADSCFAEAHRRRAKLESGVGAFCERTVKSLENQGCENILIYYHQHRGAEHEGDTGTVHDHWVDVHANILCKDEGRTVEVEEEEGYRMQEGGAQDYGTQEGEAESYQAQDSGTQDGHAAAAALTPKCEGMAEGAHCWKELANEAGCYVWDISYSHNETVTWSGQCSGGIAMGRGELTWRWSDGSSETTGELRDGKRHGHWVERYSNGNVLEGSYRDGKRHGHWVVRFADGGIHEGPAKDGKRHGNWVERSADGDVSEGSYKDGKKHGRWVERSSGPYGSVREGSYRDGERHGQWVFRYSSGKVSEGPYVDGEKHGRWVIRWADGDVKEGPYVDGKKHGRWVERDADGDVEEGPYVDGERHGRWVERNAEYGQVWEGLYVDGKKHGSWVVHSAYGCNRYEYSYGNFDHHPVDC